MVGQEEPPQLGQIEFPPGFQDQLIRIRRDIHAHPELGFEEVRTAGLVAEFLQNLGLAVTSGIGRTGVVGILRGGRLGKTIAIRSDMDALPIAEENDTPYASKEPGKMHACGHDGHTTMNLGAAMLLAQQQESLPGQVKFIFQPAEEIAPGGAEAMLADGALEDPSVDAIIGLHLTPDLPTGTLRIRPGIMMGLSEEFVIRIRGKGGHGARPHQTVDPIYIGAQVVTALQSIVSRNIDPAEPVAVSFGQFHAGTVFNVIPSTACLNGTVRCLDPDVSNYVKQRLEALIQGIVRSNGGEYEFNYIPNCPRALNDPMLTALVQGVAVDLLGPESVQPMLHPSLGTEDFCYFSARVPGAYFQFGTKNVARGITYPLHGPKFDIDEAVLPLGAALLARIAREFLQGRRRNA